MLAWRASGHRRVRHHPAAHAGQLQLSSAVSGADAHGDAAAVPPRRAAVCVAIDEEDQFYGAAEAEARRGRPHAALWTFDVSDWERVQPLAMFEVSELDSPYSRTPGGRFGAHQFAEQMVDSLVYCAWFSGGLRVVDLADPIAPREVAWFIPEPRGGRPSPQSNDVEIDERGLVYLADRNIGLDILELAR